MRRLIYILILVLAVVGCKTTDTSIEKVSTDTLVTRYNEVVNIRDSVVLRDSVITNERIVIRDSVVIILDTAGNVVGKERYRDVEKESNSEKYKDNEKHSSSDTAVSDSAYHSSENIEKEKETVKEEPNFIDRLSMTVGRFALGVILGVLACVVVYLVWKFIIRGRLPWKENGES